MLRRISKSSLRSGDGERLVFRELDRRTPFLFKRSEALDERDDDLERESEETAPLTDLLLADPERERPLDDLRAAALLPPSDIRELSLMFGEGVRFLASRFLADPPSSCPLTGVCGLECREFERFR